MQKHLFHIPVMGIGYTLDTPIKVAKYGISSAVSIVQDDVLEKVRKHYSTKYPELSYYPIKKGTSNYRSNRITAYLNMVKDIVAHEFEKLKMNPEEVRKYLSMLPDIPPMDEKKMMEMIQEMVPGEVDVNVMTKVDRPGMRGETSLSEACSAVLGFVKSELQSSLILSAGLNPRVFSFMEQFDEFMPDKQGVLKKKVTLKVSDHRSAYVQGKILAKKGIWVSEFRIESGLNCGGHAFATQGYLMGPILQEFVSNRESLTKELGEICNNQLTSLNRPIMHSPHFRLTVQGGIGTSEERAFLERQYGVDSTGWGSPFLLVPEATSIDDDTLAELVNAGEDDIYQSNVSPLGIKFNTIRNNNADRLRRKRIAEGKPGGPCNRKHLALATDPVEKQACMASSSYQKQLIDQLNTQHLDEASYKKAFDKITGTECLCNGLALSLLKKLNVSNSGDGKSISVCPGPNLAYFNRTYSLKEIVDHIYGRNNLTESSRPHFFIKEVGLYLDHLEEEILAVSLPLTTKSSKFFDKFIDNIRHGFSYYRSISSQLFNDGLTSAESFEQALGRLSAKLDLIESNLQQLKHQKIAAFVTT